MTIEWQIHNLRLKRITWATIALVVVLACKALEQPLVGRIFKSVKVNGKQSKKGS